MAQNCKIRVYFSTNAISAYNGMSHTTIAPNFKMPWFPNKGHYSVGKLKTDINLVTLMSDEDKTLSVSLLLDLRI